MYFAMKFSFKRWHKFRQTRAQSGNPHGLDAFLPGILIIGCNRIDFFEQHLRCELCALRRQIGAAITAKNAFSYDGGGKSRSGNAGEQSGTLVGEKSYRRKRCA